MQRAHPARPWIEHCRNPAAQRSILTPQVQETGLTLVRTMQYYPEQVDAGGSGGHISDIGRARVSRAGPGPWRHRWPAAYGAPVGRQGPGRGQRGVPPGSMRTPTRATPPLPIGLPHGWRLCILGSIGPPCGRLGRPVRGPHVHGDGRDRLYELVPHCRAG